MRLCTKINSYVKSGAFLLLFGFFVLQMPSAFALEDGLVVSNKKLSDIKIEDNTIIDVFPLYTVMNEKNMLIVHPLRIGNTRFSVLKNNKDIVLFNVKVAEYETVIDPVDGFDVFQIDCPPNFYEFELDVPPEIFMEEAE